MKMSEEEFVSGFHSLKGVTVGEMRKNLFLLLNNFQEGDFSNFDFSRLQPKNILEENFKIDVLIYFKRVQELLEMLKSENPENIKRIFKIDNWFIERAFGNATGKDLLSGLFPFISFNVKVKLLNKLSEVLTDTQQANEIFHEVKDVYGLHLASKILPACSFDLVIHVLQTHKLKLPPKHVNHIIKKYPEHREELLKTLELFNIEKQCNNVLEFLRKTDVITYLVLRKKHKHSKKLGWRTSAKFINQNKESVIENPNAYYEFLHTKQIAKSLGGDFHNFFKNLFPDNLKDFMDLRKLILSKLNLLKPKLNSLDLYLSTFHSMYGCEIWDHPDLVTIKLLKMLNPQEREKRIKDEYRPSSVTEDEWKCLYNIRTSIPFLKKRISLTSDVKTRAQLIGFLVDTCKINEDKAALSNICKYVLSKHRNDNIHVRKTFLNHIRENFVLEKLEEEHWESLNELIQIFQMNQESYYEESVFFEGYVHYCLRNNLPIKELLSQSLTKGEKNFNLIRSQPAFEKICLETFGEIVPEVAKNNKLFVDYLCALHEYNCRNKNNQIPLFAYPKAIDALKENISEFTWNKTVYEIALIFFNNDILKDKSQSLKLVLSASNRYSGCKVFDNVLKKEPELILKNIDDVMPFIMKTVNTHKNIFLKRLRYYQHWNLPEAAVECCNKYEKCLTDCAAYEKVIIEASAFKASSLLMPKNDFLAYLSNFYPEEPRACADKDKYKKQKLLCLNMRNIYPVSEALPSVLTFCKGDYFKLVLGSLYSLCGNLNEHKLIPVLNDLSNRAVSVQKHCLHLSFRYTNRQLLYGAINKFLEKKSNVSVRKFILKVLFNFFSKNPDAYPWNLFKTSVNNLDESDKEAYDLFLQIDKIPKEYLLSYQVFAWNVLYKLQNPRKELESKRASLLNSVDNDGSQKLPVDFCQKIIYSNLFHSDDVDVFQASVQAFACKFIIYCKDRKEKEERLKSIFAMMKHYIDNKWVNPEYREKTRTCCSKFLHLFCSEFLNNRSDDKEILQNLFQMWNGLLQPHEAFGDYLHLKFTLMHSEKYSLQQFAKEFIVLCNDLTGAYGSVIVEFIYNAFIKLTDFCLKREGQELNSSLYEFIENLANFANSDVSLLITILLLHEIDSYDSKVKDRKNELIEKLGNNKSVAVNLFLNRHIRGKTTLDYY